MSSGPDIGGGRGAAGLRTLPHRTPAAWQSLLHPDCSLSDQIRMETQFCDFTGYTFVCFGPLEASSKLIKHDWQEPLMLVYCWLTTGHMEEGGSLGFSS